MIETSIDVPKDNLTAGQRKFSLVLATVGRTHEVERFLCSLDRQYGIAFELIVVDQNPDNRLAPYLEARKSKYPILHVHTKRRGASHARNVGLRHVSGDFVAFPDDDCWYPDGLLERVSLLLMQHPDWDGITCISRDANGAVSNGRFAKHGGLVKFLKAWGQSIEYTMFFKRIVVDIVGAFDEKCCTGSGTPFGSGEGTDYLVRVVGGGFKIYYQPELFVHHPNPYLTYDRRERTKAHVYGAGMGYVVRKHGYPVWFKAKILIRPFGGTLLSLAHLRYNKALYYFNIFLGRFQGLTCIYHD